MTTITAPQAPAGKAWLVGAGPGHADLITRRGHAALARAELLLYDRLVAADLLNVAPPDAERLFVGKRPGHHPKPQAEINRLLLAGVRAGKRVVRLKGGDPFVFGRGGEEALVLAAHSYDFEVVPGVTSPLAVPAHAGIPVTDRALGAAFTIFTGHEDPTKPRSQNDWAALAQMPTLVILMALYRLHELVDSLRSAGRAGETPAAVVSRGATAAQRRVVATLETLATAVEAADLATPAIVIIGDVVGMYPELDWFAPLRRRASFVSVDDATCGAPPAPTDIARISLVGAGPGSPDLITQRGARALSQADVILHDRLVAPELLASAPDHAERVNVGKAPARERFSQRSIDQLLVSAAQSGRRVVRLKGGDPFVFGLGAEECRALRAAQIDFEVIPGVSSVTAVPALAGIPVTHRNISTMLTVLSAHNADEETIAGVAWKALPRGGTFVLLMGARKVSLIARALLANGHPPETPLAAIESGTTAAQRVTVATLKEAASPAHGGLSTLEPPALIVIGDVVQLRTQLTASQRQAARSTTVWGAARPAEVQP